MTKEMLKKQIIPDITFSPDIKTENEIAEFQNMILSFYRFHGRHDMIWRNTANPYYILVSEIMLQQTQVERVAIKYPIFIERFPDIQTLSTAPVSEVIRQWQGMGYNRRAIALKKCAERIDNEYGGHVPQNPRILETFPGIGPATASSICAFAFNLPVIFIETNIRRVYIHYFFRDKTEISDNHILPLVEKTLYREDPRSWYYALMDLGSALKRGIPNPNRRSSGYTKQSPFEGSDRRLRGLIVSFLIDTAPATLENVAHSVNEPTDRIRHLLDILEKEGFVRKEQDQYFLSD